jgi:hypothetical protein
MANIPAQRILKSLTFRAKIDSREKKTTLAWMAWWVAGGTWATQCRKGRKNRRRQCYTPLDRTCYLYQEARFHWRHIFTKK